MSVVALVVALVLLTAGADVLVRGASRLAGRYGVSRLLIGLTVVAFGTSAPELAVSVESALTGKPDLAVGNVVGSNIFNVLCILGLSALITPLQVAARLVRLDIPLLVAVSLLLLVLGLDGTLERLDGLFLAAGAAGYTVLCIRLSGARREEPAPAGREPGGVVGDVVRILAGLGLLVIGARVFVGAATELARALGVSELVIGLTVVAAGTSLPELATSVVAALRGERDVAVGNVIGSNMLNILAILGVSALLAPHGLPVAAAVVRFDLPVMIAAAATTLPLAVVRGRIARWEGLFFLVAYVLYTTYLVLAASQHDALPGYSAVMLRFVLPLVGTTLVVLLAQGLARRYRRDGRGADE